MTSVPRAIQVALGAAAVLAALLLARTASSPGTKMALFALAAGLVVLVTLRYERQRLPRAGVERADREAVMPGAEDNVAEFEIGGFRRVGGYRWALRGRLVIETVLAPPSMDRYAIATDRVLEVSSRFGDRTLVTTNSGRAPVAAGVLRQVVQPGRPEGLLRAHEQALDQLANRGLRPDRFPDDEAILREVLAVEQSALRRARTPSLATLLVRGTVGDERDRELGEDSDSRRRVEHWLEGGP